MLKFCGIILSNINGSFSVIEETCATLQEGKQHLRNVLNFFRLIFWSIFDTKACLSSWGQLKFIRFSAPKIHIYRKKIFTLRRTFGLVFRHSHQFAGKHIKLPENVSLKLFLDILSPLEDAWNLVNFKTYKINCCLVCPLKG